MRGKFISNPDTLKLFVEIGVLNSFLTWMDRIYRIKCKIVSGKTYGEMRDGIIFATTILGGTDGI